MTFKEVFQYVIDNSALPHHFDPKLEVIPQVNVEYVLTKLQTEYTSRICRNCKYWGAEHEHVYHPNYRTCINTESFTYMQEPHFEEGCNKFERKGS